jgi:predicted ribosome quality control (RQC) complex YloA/Tae2 family protein
MINIDFLTLKAFLYENIDFLIGSRLQKIQQPTRKDFLFYLRNNSESRKLYVNISPQIYHLAFISPETEFLRGIEIPKHPPMFCMLLRKYLEGCRISDALVVEHERILELHFEVNDEFSQKRSLCLCFELMGKHSNIILYDRETSIIIGCAHNVGAEKSRYRELKGGLKYIYPPKSLGISNELKLQFQGLSQEKINNYLERAEFSPAINGERYTLFQELLEGSASVESVNKMIDIYYSKYQSDIKINSIKSSLKSIVEPKLKKVNSSISKISALLQKRDNSEKYKLWGELLTANLYKKTGYTSQIEVFNYISGKNELIELDQTKTLNENAQRYFKLYTKSKTTKAKSNQILQELNIEKTYLENILYSIENADNTDLQEISTELGVQNIKQQKKEIPHITKVNLNGFEVYIGKNNKQNDYIISKISKDEDYWFHTRLCAGSHVLLKVKENEPDEETLFECCKLARQYSSATQPSKVGVIYTKRKYIKKPPAAPLGYVTYKNEREVLV